MRKGFLAIALSLIPASLACADQPIEKLPISAQPTVLGSSCGPDGCGACTNDVCGPPGRFWVSAEYLLWWIKDSHLPPLVTASSASPLAVLGAPGTSTLFGGNDLDHESFSGARFNAGMWLNDCHTVGIEGSYFFLGSRSNDFIAGNAGSPALSRPIIDAVTGLPSAEAVTAAGVVTGSVRVSNTSRLEGGNINGLCNLWCCCTSRVDLIAGFRYIELNEGLGVREDLAIVPGNPIPAGTAFGIADQFDTQNRFYGGLLGVRTERWWGRTFANLTGSVAFGSTHQVVGINGTTIIAVPGSTPSVQSGGLLAQPTNIGRYSHDDFSVVPEIGINVGYQVTDHVRAFMGYTFLYWSDVVRPGDQVDLTVNTSQLPALPTRGTLVGPARPAPILRDTDFWAQGLNFGLEFRF